MTFSRSITYHDIVYKQFAPFSPLRSKKFLCHKVFHISLKSYEEILTFFVFHCFFSGNITSTEFMGFFEDRCLFQLLFTSSSQYLQCLSLYRPCIFAVHIEAIAIYCFRRNEHLYTLFNKYSYLRILTFSGIFGV